MDAGSLKITQDKCGNVRMNTAVASLISKAANFHILHISTFGLF